MPLLSKLKLKLHRDHGRQKLETLKKNQHAGQEGEAASPIDLSTSLTKETKVSSDGTASLPNPSEQLWNNAYDQLKQKEPKLVDAYETILSQALSGDNSGHQPLQHKNSIAQTDISKRLSQMNLLIQTGLARTEKEVKVKQSVGEVMQKILLMKDVVSFAVQAMPQAALAWTGVCFALQIFTNSTTESKTNRDGLDHVIERMKWYDELSRPLLRYSIDDDRSFAGMHSQLETRVVHLYQELLSYLIKSVCSYYRNRFLVFLRDTLKLDGWNGGLKNVEDAERVFRLDSSIYNTQKNTTNIETLAKIATSTEDNDCLRHLRVSDPRYDKKRIEQTKGGLLQDSYRWILENDDFRRWRTDDQSRLLWIKGDPGKGKTMLLCGIIDEMKRDSFSAELLSYFFCQATDTRINTATAVLRGLIYLLVDQCPSLISHVRKRYDQAGKSLFEDANTWVALSEIFEDVTQDPRLENAYLVIDALDECVAELPRLLDLIIRSFSSSSRLKWVVSSRNWPVIEERLEKQDEKATLSLELNAKSVSEAVGNYVKHKVHHLAQLKEYNDEIKTSVQEYLLLNANGTFLWVALVCQNLEGTSRWKTLTTLKIYPPGLKPLYQRMMQLIYDSEDGGLLKQILALTAVVYRPVTLDTLTSLMHMPDSFADNPIWLEELVKQCGSFLTIREGTVYFVHQSAKDFILKNASDEIFPSGTATVHYDVWSKSIEGMSSLKRDVYDLQDPSISRAVIEIPEEDPLKPLRYSCVYFIDHLLAVDKCFEEAGSCDQEEIRKFFKKHFLHWLEALSLMDSIGDGIRAINRLLIRLQKKLKSFPLVALLKDMRRFALLNKDVVEAFPLQTYISALIFCPIHSMTRQLFKDNEPEWIILKPTVEKGWNSCLQTLEGHSGAVNSVAFSPDGQKIVSGSWDKTVRVWDTATGSLLQTLEGHSNTAYSVAFSPDGQKIVSRSGDKTVRVWDTATGSLLQTLKGHRYSVTSIAASLNNHLRLILVDDHWVTIHGKKSNMASTQPQGLF